MRAACVSSLITLPQVAGAQDLPFLGDLFKNATSATLFFEAATIRNSPQLDTKSSQCVLHSVCGAGTEILFSVTPPDASLGVELGLGASYLRGFSGKELPDTFDLHGSIRSFPILGAYVSWNRWGRLSPYLGGNFGLSDLWNAQVYNAHHQQISVGGQTFNYGILSGLSYDLGAYGAPFIEGGYHARRFASVRYGADKDTIPQFWPREMDLTGWQIQIGWQFNLKPPEVPKKPAPLQGVWILTSIDGIAVPAPLDQSEQGPRVVRHELVAARLDFRKDTTYTAVWQERQLSLDPDGNLRRLEPHLYSASGRYSIDADGRIKLIPADQATRALGFDAIRVSDELVLTHLSQTHTLVFKKSGL